MTAQVLEEIKSVLDKQTQNLSSLLVLQEKYNHLQAQVTTIQAQYALKELDEIKDTTKELETLKIDLDKANKEIDKQNGFVEKFMVVYMLVHSYLLYSKACCMVGK